MVRKVHQWYETSMVRIVYGTKSLATTQTVVFGEAVMWTGVAEAVYFPLWEWDAVLSCVGHSRHQLIKCCSHAVALP